MEKDKSLPADIEDISIGEHPPELKIKLSQPINHIDLNKIVLRDVVVPNAVRGFKVKAQ